MIIGYARVSTQDQNPEYLDRDTFMLMRDQGYSLRAIGIKLRRAPSTLSRELRRHISEDGIYDAGQAAEKAVASRIRCRPRRKLIKGTDLYCVVHDMLRNLWSRQQISGTLKVMFPNHPEYQVSHETVYKTIYAVPYGELRKELITCLRQGHTKRRPRAGGVGRRQQIPDMVSIHLWPPSEEIAQTVIWLLRLCFGFVQVV